MARSNVQQLTARLVGALLALAMLVSPALAQVMSAEACRTRCERMGETLTSACCCNDSAPTSPANPQLDHHDRQSPTDRGTDAGATYCPGCNGRPLIASGERINLSLDNAPLFVAATAPLATLSADVSLSIFHPPRA